MKGLIIVVFLSDLLDLPSHLLIFVFKDVDFIVFIYHHVLQFFNNVILLAQLELCFLNKLGEIKVNINVSLFAHCRNWRWRLIVIIR